MAPSPEYDKEPKAPDKSASNISSEDSKLLNNLIKDQHHNSDHKTTNSATNSEVENNKHVETLDDDKLRALLNEALTYKCPKDLEGKSNLFKELFEEVKQDEQEACEAAARNLTGRSSGGRRARGRHALAHSNSLQDLVAALAAEPAPRRHARHHPPAHHPPVSARAIHGGSLPSGVDTSSLLSEDGGSCSGAGYLATVRCVNPPPLAERRVSASDDNTHELEILNRRSKPMFPMTYTARATLEIGSGSVCSGRAVTTTTASNQVRTRTPPAGPAPARPAPCLGGGGAQGAPAGKRAPRGPRSRSEDELAFVRNLDLWYDGLAAYTERTLRRPAAASTPRPAPRDNTPYVDLHDCALSDRISSEAAGPSTVIDSSESDIRIRKTYREKILPRVPPTLPPINPRNVRCMSIGAPPPSLKNVDSRVEGALERAGDAKLNRTEPEVAPPPDGIPADARLRVETDITESTEDQTSKCFQMSEVSPPARTAPGGAGASAVDDTYDIELEEIVCHRATDDDTGFADYLADQRKLFRVLEADSKTEDEYPSNVPENNNNVEHKRAADVRSERDSATEVSSAPDVESGEWAGSGEVALRRGRPDDRADRYILAELPNNAYIFLTLPERSPAAELRDPARRRKKDEAPVGSSSSARRKDAINKNALRVLLFENLLKSDRGEPHGRASPSADKEVDSAIPFSCITTPEVVGSCNTTPAPPQPQVAVDPKPLQLGSEYRAGSSLGGAPAAPAPAAPPPDNDREQQPRSVIASSFNGLPLSRPYGPATTSTDEYKKSLDENGNAVQGYSSPLSGSSQHKKPRRKKSSKNETVIDCRQLDGYQGDKDVNELLRFIESDGEPRAPKLRKHHDDDKGKKRSSERRKDKDPKPKRASSLEELSRTTLEELTAPPEPERRSWGGAAPAVPPAPEPALAEQADFQTVTKKRKPRRRTEEAAPRRARAPSPRRQDSAPPSERSNDSNDDTDSPTSPPPAPAPAPPHASYADIARTRHNIPDLIESCNYYAEGAGEPRRRVEPAPPAPDPPPADPYPALETRAEPATAPPAARRKPAAAARRKERAATAPAPPAPDCPAPDVVADRRPPVILLDSAAHPRDMDGVTFGFDINEQLLVGAARRPRCDLVRDAVEAAPAPPAPPAPGVSVRAAKRALRYVPPPPADHTQLHQIVDYIGGAWDEVVRCGSGGKVRYFSE